MKNFRLKKLMTRSVKPEPKRPKKKVIELTEEQKDYIKYVIN
jgi:hypothetical protein